MNYDAQEAALGLLGLCPNNLSPLVTTPTIPAKRKQGPNSAIIIRDDSNDNSNDKKDNSQEDIRCICGFTYDDGFSIACDDCSRWCHAACFDIVEGEVPEEWFCWECFPRPVDSERAAKFQRERLKGLQVGPEKKQRRQSIAAIEGGKRKRRLSMVQQPQQQPVVPNEDEHIDIDEPWTHSYVHITQDVVPEDTCIKLRRQAHHWRGITAISDTPLQPVCLSHNSPSPPPTIIKPISSPTNVRPPSYAVHTTSPIPSSQLITPYTSCITPSSLYLSDSLNSYAHLGMPKPFVHLLGPPLDIALDSRIAGNRSRFVRNGCRPNAVLRPVLCGQPRESETLTFGVFSLRDLKANEEVVLGWEWDDGNAVHALPALIETPGMFPLQDVDHLRNQMSNILHALSSTFTTCACGARAKDCVLTQMAAFVDNEVSSTTERVDLGPLVGRRRGFRTREKIPFSGGMGGVEMVSETEDEEQEGSSGSLPSFVLSPASSSTKKGKGKATSLDAEEDVVRGRSGVNYHQGNRNRKDRRSRHISPHHSPSHPQLELPTKHPSGLATELRPPDTMQMDDQELTEDKMPPKMRKKWIHREFESLKEANGRVHLPESMSIDSSKNPQGVGLGIHIDNEDVDVEMPPPPIPASLDPTTMSSLTKSFAVHRNHPPQHQSNAESCGHLPPSASPTTSFAKLSLLSPMVTGSISQAQKFQFQQAQGIDHFGPDGCQKGLEDDQDVEQGQLSNGQVKPSSPPHEQQKYLDQHPSLSRQQTPSPRQSNQFLSPSGHPFPFQPPSHAPAVQLLGSPTQNWRPFRRLASPASHDPPPSPVWQALAQCDYVTSSPTCPNTTLPLSCMRHEVSPPPAQLSVRLGVTEYQDEEGVSHVELGEDPSEEVDHDADDGDDNLTLAYPSAPEINTEAPISTPSLVHSLAEAGPTVLLPGSKSLATSSWIHRPISSAPDSIASTPPAGVSNGHSGREGFPPAPLSPEISERSPRPLSGSVVDTPLVLASNVVTMSEEGGGSARIIRTSEDVRMAPPEEESAFQVQSQPPASRLPLPRLASLSPPADAREPTPPPTARSPTHSPTPRPPPAPKVKMSLKDFALRKKKQREEEMLTKCTQASPVTENLSLVSDGEEIAGKEDPGEVAGVEEVITVLEDPSPENCGSSELEKDSGPDEKPAAELNGAAKEEIRPATNVGGVLPLANGVHINLPSPPPCLPSPPSRLPTKPPTSLPSRPQLAASPGTRQAKQELIEPRIASVQPHHPNGRPFSLIDRLKGPLSFQPLFPHKTLPRRPSNEDDEIGQTSPSPATHEQPKPVYVPRSVSPPKQPRALMGYPYNNRPTPSPISSTPPVFRNPPPTGPRALRNSMPPRQLAVSPPNIPRGPSADRDRVDWDQRRSHSSRNGHNGWCR